MRKKKWPRDAGRHEAGDWWDEEAWQAWLDARRHTAGSEGDEDATMPPWMLRHGKRHAGPWRHHAPSSPRLFFRFFFVFGLLVLLGCGVLAALAIGALFLVQGRLLSLPAEMGEWHPARWFLTLLLFASLLALAFRWAGRLAARRLTDPLSETMQAADALAAGDLSARVSVSGSGDFRHFTRTFNRMAAALETADRQRRELLADVAHELRTPLAVIQGNLEGLRDGVYDATPDHLELVLDETQKLARLVDDLRLLTLVEAGQLPLDLQTLDVRQFLADVRDVFACRAEEAGITLAVDAPGALPPLVADPQRLGQVFGNLVTNALRHTSPGGRVTLGADVGPDGAGVQLRVADTGEGIAPDDLPRIFDRFWRGDPARVRGGGAGSGLGLAIARSLVEAHGGRVWAESRQGEGTTIRIDLPTAG
ncbi:MAG: HAMP domain-containing sensor histidine kinase [Anaerolineae bacterium]|jgi:two-component system OmpR family sensor kinase/two-component system sensor histidine kinase BaeS